MDVIELSTKIEQTIQSIQLIMQEYEKAGAFKVQTESDYDISIGKTIIQLKNGKEFNIDNEIFNNPPISIMEKIAKRICWQEKLKKEEAEVRYKLMQHKLKAFMAQLSAYQSLNKHLGAIGG